MRRSRAKRLYPAIESMTMAVSPTGAAAAMGDGYPRVAEERLDHVPATATEAKVCRWSWGSNVPQYRGRTPSGLRWHALWSIIGVIFVALSWFREYLEELSPLCIR